MELVESEIIHSWTLSPLGRAGNKPVGFIMKFNNKTKVMINMIELEQMHNAFSKAYSMKDSILEPDNS